MIDRAKRHRVSHIPLCAAWLLAAGHAAPADEQIDPALTEVWDPEPEVVTPGTGNAPPSDAIVLLGDELSEWLAWDGNAHDGSASTPPGWEVSDGVATVVSGAGGIRSKRSFGSVQLHLEWRAPLMEGSGQLKGNSGVFLQQRYEVQILDSYQNRTYSNGQAASVYKQHMPLVNAARSPGDWQSYDIVFEAPAFDASGKLVTPGYVTVLHNGVLVQNHVELEGSTVYRGQPSYEAHGDAPLALQDHGDRVSFRNIWVRDLSRRKP